MSHLQKQKYQIVDSEDDSNERKIPPRSASRPVCCSWQWLTLVMICIGQAVVIVFLTAQIHSKCKSHENELVERVVWQDDPRFQNLQTIEDVKQAWSLYGPLPTSGFVHLNSDEVKSFNLKPNKNVIPGGMENVYVISAFHSLHCLQFLHLAYFVFTHNRTDEHVMGENHAVHCLNYLRQSIVCAGDMAIEDPNQDSGPEESPLRAWSVEHTCRSWKGVEEWRDKRSIMLSHSS
ncbi:hypothetical protein QBC38DRAFT_448249 [Podospora fimiseda]|uniref:Cyclochlorotine biosynthesis protein O n=1 Tax=Podospora fimiseda TaxID=252190 RepID=A0AAN6YRA4_9PEZI|nr:hypothetical protein QBC38DRAFT_448249 [Podospora fimiseda]